MGVPLTIQQLGNGAGLQHRIVKRRLPRSENYRTYFGRQLNPKRIEAALREAECGLMVNLTDLESEAIGLDPHLLGVCQKRYGSLQSLSWTLDQAKGPDTDQREAKLIMETVRAKLSAIPSFSERIYDLAWGSFDGRSALENHWHLQRHARFPWSVTGMEWVHPRRLSFNQERELLIIDTFQAFTQFTATGIPIEQIPGKFTFWKPRLFREYQEREGIGPRTMYWAFFKRFSNRMRMILTELFAIPWRVIKPAKDAPGQGDSYDSMKTEVEALGRESVAQLDRGVDLDVVFPGENSGNLFQMTIEDVDKQISKLVLGNTGTTEGSETNRSTAIVQKSEQDIILTLEATAIAERLQQQLILAIVVLNFGASSVVNAPKFRFLTDPPRDREKDLDAADKVLTMGLPVAVDEVYERADMRKPDPDDVVVVKQSSGGTDALGNALPAVATIVDPTQSKDLDDASRDVDALEEGGLDRARDDAENLAAVRLETLGHSTAISDNHGHDLSLRALEETTFDIQGGADHTHKLQITAQDITAIQSGLTATITSGPGPDGHMHTVTVGRFLELSGAVAESAAAEVLRLGAAPAALPSIMDAIVHGRLGPLLGHLDRDDAIDLIVAYGPHATSPK